jgi:ketosteroid isomerase-like protein
MATDHVETVRRLADAVNRADKKAAFGCMSPGVIWNATGELELVDQKLHYNGRDEVWGYLTALDEAFGSVHVDLDSIEEVGNLVVARVQLRSAGRAGSAEADLVFSSVARFKEGRIAKVENYVDHDEAMNDAELRAQD